MDTPPSPLNVFLCLIATWAASLIFVSLILFWLRLRMDLTQERKEGESFTKYVWRVVLGFQKDRIPPVVTGMAEQAMFLILVAYEFPSVSIAMFAWIGLKLATNWNRPDLKYRSEITRAKKLNSHPAVIANPELKKLTLEKRKLYLEAINQKNNAWVALVGGVISMTFAIVGGLIARGDIPIKTVITTTIGA